VANVRQRLNPQNVRTQCRRDRLAMAGDASQDGGQSGAGATSGCRRPS